MYKGLILSILTYGSPAVFPNKTTLFKTKNRQTKSYRRNFWSTKSSSEQLGLNETSLCYKSEILTVTLFVNSCVRIYSTGFFDSVKFILIWGPEAELSKIF